MTTTRRSISSNMLFAILCAGLLWSGQTALATPIAIDTVPVGNLGNSADTTGRGAVSYGYNIGTTEVTNAQYAAFLNAKAASDLLALYSTSMAGGFGGITRSGSSGNYTYSTIGGRENKPVNYVSWYDAVRFANWLHNGQGTGDTETGAYTLGPVFPDGTPVSEDPIVRNPNATWVIPTADEWYKAAYHKNDGNTANYFEYPTSSDTAPTAEVPAGGSNSANYEPAPFVNFGITDSGAYTASDSPYGTFDQGGNVWEWTESLVIGHERGFRGGSFSSNASAHNLSASYPGGDAFPTYDSSGVGFRVVTVPEPSSPALAGMGLVGLMLFVSYRRRHVARLRAIVAAVCLAAVPTANAATITDVGDGWKLLTDTDLAENEGTYWMPLVASYDEIQAVMSTVYEVATTTDLFQLKNESLSGDLADPTNLLPAETYNAFEFGTLFVFDDLDPTTIDLGVFEITSSSMSLFGEFLPVATFDSAADRPWVLRATSNPVPEPSTFMLAALAMLGLSLFARRRSRNAVGLLVIVTATCLLVAPADAATITTFDFSDNSTWDVDITTFGSPTGTGSSGVTGGGTGLNVDKVGGTSVNDGVTVTATLIGSISTVGFENISLSFAQGTNGDVEFSAPNGFGVAGDGFLIVSSQGISFDATAADPAFENILDAGQTWTHDYAELVAQDLQFDVGLNNSALTNFQIQMQVDVISEEIDLSNFTLHGTVVPEPSSLALAAMGLVGGLLLLRRRRGR